MLTVGNCQNFDRLHLSGDNFEKFQIHYSSKIIKILATIILCVSQMNYHIWAESINILNIQYGWWFNQARSTMYICKTISLIHKLSPLIQFIEHICHCLQRRIALYYTICIFRNVILFLCERKIYAVSNISAQFSYSYSTDYFLFFSSSSLSLSHTHTNTHTHTHTRCISFFSWFYFM